MVFEVRNDIRQSRKLQAFDTKIDEDFVIKHRKAKSQSQEELALASAFDIEVNTLDYQEKPIMSKYEYKVLKFDLKGGMTPNVNDSEMEAQLNRHGAEGWELLHISEILDVNSQTKILLATMKRPLH